MTTTFAPTAPTAPTALEPSAIDAVHDAVTALSRLLDCADRLPSELVRDASEAQRLLLTAGRPSGLG